jgi:DNA-binding NarL/FixJ family response regulator
MPYDEYLALAQVRLSEAEFQVEQAAGRAMSLEQAINFAQNLLLKPGIPLQTGAKPGDLTERECEVVALVAQGKSNREIANELVLSRRTVEKHVGNILSKLGFTSRAQIVRWAIEKGLLQASE